MEILSSVKKKLSELGTLQKNLRIFYTDIKFSQVKFERNSKLGGVSETGSTSATDLTYVLNWCLRRICWIETIWSLKINNIMSGEQAEVGKKKQFFGLLTSCLV